MEYPAVGKKKRLDLKFQSAPVFADMDKIIAAMGTLDFWALVSFGIASLASIRWASRRRANRATMTKTKDGQWVGTIIPGQEFGSDTPTKNDYILVCCWVIGPPLWFLFEWSWKNDALITTDPSGAVRGTINFEHLKYGQELARNVWLAFVVVLAAVTGAKLKD